MAVKKFYPIPIMDEIIAILNTTSPTLTLYTLKTVA